MVAQEGGGMAASLRRADIYLRYWATLRPWAVIQYIQYRVNLFLCVGTRGCCRKVRRGQRPARWTRMKRRWPPVFPKQTVLQKPGKTTSTKMAAVFCV
jgi:hypothetical protein